MSGGSNRVLGIDAGTVETGYAIVDEETYRPLEAGIISNTEMLDVIGKMHPGERVAIERFVSYGKPIGSTTIDAIEWTGRFIQAAEMMGLKWEYVTRREARLYIADDIKAKDKDVRAGLISRFGVVGTKKDQGFFYGFKDDMWSAFAIAATAIDRRKWIENHR